METGGEGQGREISFASVKEFCVRLLTGCVGVKGESLWKLAF